TPSTRCARLSTSSNGRPTSPNPTTTLTYSPEGPPALVICNARKLLDKVYELPLAVILPRPGDGQRLRTRRTPLGGHRITQQFRHGARNRPRRQLAQIAHRVLREIVGNGGRPTHHHRHAQAHVLEELCGQHDVGHHIPLERDQAHPELTHARQQLFETKPLARDLDCLGQAKTIPDSLKASDVVPITPDCGVHPDAAVA